MEGKYRELHRLLLWRQLGHGWKPQKEFLRPDQPLFLEIGFGNGEYLLRQAQSRPQHNFLGLDIHWGSVRRCSRRLAQAGVDNVRLLQVDAHMAVRHLFPSQCFESFVALFPCPWPKRGHERFRLFSREFMAHLNRASKGGGLVVTDHRGLMEFARSEVEGSGLELSVIEIEARYDTKYERRWSGQGQQQFYELHYHQVGPPGVEQIAEAQVNTLKCEHFDPQGGSLRGSHEGVVVKFGSQVYDPQRQIWMVLTTVVEDHLSQTFWIESVLSSDDGLWHIRPAQGGGYLPTVGVQKALVLVQQNRQGVESGELGRPQSIAGQVESGG